MGAALKRLPFDEQLERTTPGGSSSSSNCLAGGARVTLVGLEATPSLNGKGAVIRGHDPMTGRWQVVIVANGEVKSVMPDKLRPAGEPVILLPDDLVVISTPGQAVDRQRGKVLRYRHDLCRYEVELEPAELSAD